MAAPDTGNGFQAADLPLDVNYENDSAYGGDSDLASATTSLKSSITNYYFENGRRYHAYRAGAYWGPNDEPATDSLDIAHHIFLQLLDGKLFLAPIGNKPQRTLDVGTGTGIWAMDFADKFPDCQVVGTDLSPIQPRDVPPNLQFEVDDACSEWTFTKNSFDFVHMRSLYGCVADWPAMYEQIMEHLKPGGYVEQVEMSVVPTSDDGTVTDDSTFADWGRTSLAAGDAFGKTLRIVNESRQHLVDAGFEDVHEHRFKLPMAPWVADPKFKVLGRWNQLHWDHSLESWCLFLFTNYLKWSYEKVQLYVAQMRRQLRDKKVHAYHEISLVYGRKPGGTAA